MMTKMTVQGEDILAMARDMGLKRMDQLDYAVLERNGEISIVENSEQS
ncbi:MAG TPA: YetF domain-containing protein [Bryobacteraceae bacterium]|nr:YetF domain-containing protein [Bryobacteraceae bacterium]